MLVDYGCDEAQGYYFSRPVPGDELMQWFETSPFGVPRRLDAALSSVRDPSFAHSALAA